MSLHLRQVQKKLKSQRGQGLVEYALILVLIALVVMAAVSGVGTKTNTVFNSVDKALTSTAAP
jgi:pilus assembly protein Flp/PilA